MAPKKLPLAAFEFYVGLGVDRSYRAVAREFGVTKRCVSRAASKERWQERLVAWENALHANLDRRSAEQQARHEGQMNGLQDAAMEVITPQRMKAIFAALLKRIVEKGDVAAARLLLDRVLGKPRNEPLPASAVDIPDGLESASDVRRAANSLLQAISSGALAPEDAAKAATVVEAARRSIESEDLERRIAAIEENLRKEKAT